MFKIHITAYSEGLTFEDYNVSAFELDLQGNGEFKYPVNIKLQINKISNEFFIKAHIKSKAHLICDRCLEDYDFVIDEKLDIILTANKSLNDEEDDIYLISESSSDVDITESIRQSLLLSLPFKNICNQDCKGLCSHCGVNLNNSVCECKNDYIDPRWEALNKIKFN